MRIIAGKARGRPIEAPQGSATRPTTDRVREALFSMIEARRELEGARVLDLYAGSGALALEALSRGATRAICVDSAASCRQVIKGNAMRLGMSGDLELLTMEVERAIPRLAAREERFDLIFLDPPYVLEPWPVAMQLVEHALVADTAIVAIEHAARASAPARIGALEVIRERCYGDTGLALYALVNGLP